MTAPATASEIFEKIRIRVRTGELRPGDTLPPVRDMAVTLGVNRNTVAFAYKKLVAAGIAVANGRNGTSIRRMDGIPEQEGVPPETLLTDASGGNPHPDVLPPIAELLEEVSHIPRLYGEPVMNHSLEDFAREWFSPDVPAGFGLNLTHGAVDAIERLVMGYLASGEKIAVEDPCFLSSINTVRSMGFVPAGVPVDQYGLMPDALETALEEGAQVLIVTPRAHNPTGCSLTAARAAELRNVLSRYPHVMIIVDDHFSLMSTSTYHSVIPAGWRRWALIRSLSKSLGPDLRMAFVASDPETSLRLAQRLAAGTNWVSHILQDMAGKALTSADIQQQLDSAARFYQRRRKLFTKALRAHGLDTGRDYDGLNIWLPLRGSPEAIVERLRVKGWIVRSGEVFSLGYQKHALRVSVSGPDESSLLSLAAEIAAAISETGNALAT
ncbi:transcriptional regulator PtsJ [[Curtobacterium] plantarum]|uniref:MocR-like B6 salvage transcription factor PtsJ n=1 Tax=[Curtobacterium] plantarum TaxID=221276 RepID=UPI000F082815|nr:transcriptional regulator PtsJ [[Curtobacterium] plantarum]RNA72323.1 transcriptional regulator PtsJ [[Curtobacterium] plantarum]